VRASRGAGDLGCSRELVLCPGRHHPGIVMVARSGHPRLAAVLARAEQVTQDLSHRRSPAVDPWDQRPPPIRTRRRRRAGRPPELAMDPVDHGVQPGHRPVHDTIASPAFAPVGVCRRLAAASLRARTGEPAARSGCLQARSGVWPASSPARARRRSAHHWEHEMGDAVALNADRWVAEQHVVSRELAEEGGGCPRPSRPGRGRRPLRRAAPGPGTAGRWCHR
jgi:hypothetical protein